MDQLRNILIQIRDAVAKFREQNRQLFTMLVATAALAGLIGNSK